MELKNCIFDMDGTLVDSMGYWQGLERDFLIRHGAPDTPALNGILEQAKPLPLIQAAEVFIQHCGLPDTPEQARAEMMNVMKGHYQRDVQLKPGAAALLSWLKTEGVAVVLATSSVRERAVEVLTRLGVVQYFDDMVFGTEIERGKPWPDIFLKAAEKAHAAPADCLVLEDSEAGIQAAHAAGIDVLCVPDMKMPAESYQQMTAAMLKSLDDVKGWLTAE